MALGDQDDVFDKLKRALVSRWFATSPLDSTTPILDGVLSGPAWMWSWLYALLQYVAKQRRIGTADSVNLDQIALDFFGNKLGRFTAESDDTFRARIKANLLAPKNTRASVIAAVQALTGVAPVIFEPRDTTDTGGYGFRGMTVGTGLGYGIAGAYGSLLLPFQAFITAYRPVGIGIAGVSGYYSRGSGLPALGGYGVGAIEYGSLEMLAGLVTDADIYQTIADVAPEATIMWTRITDKATPTQVFVLAQAALRETQASQSISAAAFGGNYIGRVVETQDDQILSASANLGIIRGTLAVTQAPQTFFGTGSIPSSWAQADATNVSLSNGNLTASTISSTQGGVRSSSSITSGTRYLEIKTTSALPGERLGFATSAWSETTALGSDTNSIGVAQNGNVWFGNSIIGNTSPWTAGATLCLAVNDDAKVVWVRINGGAWAGLVASISGSQTVGGTSPPPPPPPSGPSLDPLSASPSLTLSNSNMTVKSGSATPSGVRATAPVDISKNAKVYFEVTVDAPTEHWACGMCGELFDFTSPTGLGTTGNIIVSQVTPDSFGFFPFSGYEPARTYVGQYQQAASYLVSAGGQNTVSGDVIRVVYDTVNAVFWVSSPSMVRDGNVWNNSPLSISDPTAGIGGFVCIAGNDLYPAFWTSDNASQATFNFGASTFANTIPTGCVAYNQAALSNPTPSYTSIPAPTGLVGGKPTTTTIPLSWNAPSGGPYTYRVQRLVISGADNITKLGQIAWTDVATTGSTSVTVTVPSLANNLLNFPFRVQAISSSGTHGRWSQPQPAHAAGNGTASNLLNNPFLFQLGATTSSITITLTPQADTVTGSTISYSVWYLPLFGNMDLIPYYGHPVAYPAASPYVLVNDNVNPASSTTLTISGLSPGTQYFIYTFVKSSAAQAPPIATYIWAATAPTQAGAALKILDRNGWLIPSGAIFVDYNTDYHVFMPVGSTTHFAVYYDINVYNNANLANSVLAQVESVYSNCLTWFSASSSLHTACIESPINTDGSKINVFLTGPAYGGEHLSCANADVFVGSVPADRGYLDTAMMIVVAEVTEVFMPQLQSLPDCDQHPVGEALSISMAFSLWPNGILIGQTTANLAAYYLNTKTDADGTADPTSGTARLDWVNSNPAGESAKQYAAIGCATLFLGYLRSQLGYSFTQICTALNGLPVNATCRALYNKLANNSTDPFPAFIALLNAHFPTTSQVDSVHFTQNPFPLT